MGNSLSWGTLPDVLSAVRGTGMRVVFTTASVVAQGMDGDDAISDSHGLAAERRAHSCGTLVPARLVRLSNRPQSGTESYQTRQYSIRSPCRQFRLDTANACVARLRESCWSLSSGSQLRLGLSQPRATQQTLCFIPVIIADACGAGDEARCPAFPRVASLCRRRDYQRH